MRWYDSGWVPVTLLGIIAMILVAVPRDSHKSHQPLPSAITVISGSPKTTVLNWKVRPSVFARLWAQNKIYRGAPLPTQKPGLRFGYYTGPVEVAMKLGGKSYIVEAAYRVVPQKVGYRIRYFSPLVDVISGNHSTLYTNPALFYWLQHGGKTEGALSSLFGRL